MTRTLVHIYRLISEQSNRQARIYFVNLSRGYGHVFRTLSNCDNPCGKFVTGLSCCSSIRNQHMSGCGRTLPSCVNRVETSGRIIKYGKSTLTTKAFNTDNKITEKEENTSVTPLNPLENAPPLDETEKTQIFKRPSETSLNELDLDSVEGNIERKPGRTVAVPRETYSLASIVDQSEFLSTLVKLGVNLAKLEKKGLANDIVKLNFEQHVKPYLWLFKDICISSDDFGEILTDCPHLMMTDIEDVKLRLNYLESKKFSKESITRLVTQNPNILLMTVEKIDFKLGFYQQKFFLTGSEVRQVVTQLPKLVTWNADLIEVNRHSMTTSLGFSNTELKSIFLSAPKVLISDRFKVRKLFDYLHNTMGLTHAQLVCWPQIFRHRLHTVDVRHRFLMSIGRAQYNPRKENYVSLKALVTSADELWCSEVARTSYREFEDFLKMI